jgi:predicted AlkP superfamily pyrophosphatase or phosphodiesterase
MACQDLMLSLASNSMRPALRKDVLDADAHGLKIPHLRRFLKEGSYSTGVHGVVPTVTYPSHTTIITSVSPLKHGIYANTTFDPLLKNNGGWYWHSSAQLLILRGDRSRNEESASLGDQER